MQRIAILQPYVPDYRVPLWSAVIETLLRNGVEGRVFVGTTRREQREYERRLDACWPHWVTRVPTIEIPTVGSSVPALRFRRLPKGWATVPMLCEMQASNLNCWRAILGGIPYVTMGHGRNYLSRESRLSSRLESIMNSKAVHVLTYLPSGKDAVITRTGLPNERVTSFNNSTDSQTLDRAVKTLTPSEISDFRKAHGIPREAKSSLVLSSLTSGKRVPLLASAAQKLMQEDHTRWLIVAGDGPRREPLDHLRDATGRVVMLGRVGPKEVAQAASICGEILNPGRVGLVAVDALVLGLPVVTTSGARHAPEVEYLVQNEMLTVANDTADDFARAWRDASSQQERLGLDVPTIEGSASAISSALLELFNCNVR